MLEWTRAAQTDFSFGKFAMFSASYAPKCFAADGLANFGRIHDFISEL